MLERIKETASNKLEELIADKLINPLKRLFDTSIGSACKLVTVAAETAESKITEKTANLIKSIQGGKDTTIEPALAPGTDQQPKNEEQLELRFTDS